jgi:iron complex transport system substrate-binding protein
MAAAAPPHENHDRIVSLAPSATSILWAIGAQRLLVGVTKWCADVAQVGRLARVGDCWSGDTAPIARLRPTLLVGSVPFKPEMLARLLELGIPLLAMNPRSLADVYADIRLLGRLTGRATAAARVVRKMQSDLRQIASGAKHHPAGTPCRAARPRVYCEAWPNPRISSPPWVAELVRIAGGTPVVPAGQKVTDEQVAAANPDIIVLAWAATGAKSDPRRTLGNPAWRDVPAVRNRRVFAIRDEFLNTPSPVLVTGARILLRTIQAFRRRP